MEAMARSIAMSNGGEDCTEPGLERCWWFPSCAAARNFYRAAFRAGLKVWASADMAGVLLPSDASWASWEVDRSIIP